MEPTSARENFSENISTPPALDALREKVGDVYRDVSNRSKQALEPAKLHAYTPSHPTATQLVQHMQIAKRLRGLTHSQQEKIVHACIQAYKESMEAFETTLGELAAKHPDAQAAALEMARRLAKIAKAYYEVLTKEDSGHMKELKIRLGTALEFATYAEGKSSGSVGFNPIAIEKVLEGGNLREVMMLIYASVWTMLPKIFSDPSLTAKVNSKLEGFQLNMKAIQERGTDVFAQSSPLAAFRKAGGRIAMQAPPEARSVSDLSLREARAAFSLITEQEFTSRKDHLVEWVRGKDMFRVDEGSDFYKKAVQLGGIPVVTGPSGTVDGFLQAAHYLNMHKQQNALLLALSGWMIQGGDHSYHEVREAASWHGIPYTPGPEAYEETYDPDFQNLITDNMNSQGKRLPGYYLGAEYQYKVAQDLGFVKKP